jgi:hypothetical protein
VLKATTYKLLLLKLLCVFIKRLLMLSKLFNEEEEVFNKNLMALTTGDCELNKKNNNKKLSLTLSIFFFRVRI